MEQVVSDTVTTTLLLAGVAGAVLFISIILIEGAFRSGYSFTYHTGSELAL